ncbi:hypothetical protein WJX81_006966 [Elliptochloris bilobata]|uniref:3'-5' exonuclease domain-containing protein n=1 Tax=Elliptochloris bilobata TaxID=381761 RepID=A0AAW1RJD4_9CHLO
MAVHLLLDILPALCASLPACTANADVQQRTAGLFAACLSPARFRMAAKVAAGFGLTPVALHAAGVLQELPQDGTGASSALGLLRDTPADPRGPAAAAAFERALAARLADLLCDCATATPAVSLFRLWPRLAASHLHLRGALLRLADDTHLRLAREWVDDLGGDCQAALVEHCLAEGRAKDAWWLVRELRLQAAYPGAEALYRRHTLRSLAERQRWAAAAAFCAGDAGLQAELIRELVAAGEAELAEQLHAQAGLPGPPPVADPVRRAARVAADAAKYLQPALAADAVHWVAHEAGLAAAVAAAVEADAVGLDVEWRPGREGCTQPPASLLQVATRERVWLVDLMALRGGPGLAHVLPQLLRAPTAVKLGCSLSSDLTALARVGCSAAGAAPLLDTRRRRTEIALSTISERVLGRPLNKAMQTSDWEARPLSPAQVAYAALDAHALVRIYDALAAHLGRDALLALPGQHRA